jgi:GTP-binding protein LepA
VNPKLIRNFCIIAHIDHGKSTLADRILELTHAVSAREAKAQYLDSMDLERERGITIKASSVRLHHVAEDGQTYQFNLIDTPGHVDFNYEVSRSLNACEGALLVVDATQGVQAQTLANVYLALEQNLEIIPVLNKIDLPGSDPERCREEIEEVIGLDGDGILSCSAKTGEGVAAILEAIVARVPPPKGRPEAEQVRALIFDSWFDNYRGATALVRVVDGTLKPGQKIQMMSTGQTHEVLMLGCNTPQPVALAELTAGQVGFLTAQIKTVSECKIGDTVTSAEFPATEALPGFKEVQPMVFCGLYPTESHDYENLRDALTKLNLNDAAFRFEPETSQALGFGFRVGFLGLLHMEIIQERLEREYNLDLITTAPSVVYEVKLTDGEMIHVENPSKLPPAQEVEEIREPFVTASIHVPQEYLGAVLKLCEDRRGRQKELNFPTKDRCIVVYDMPLAEIVYDFFDKLKSVTRGYASLDYELSEYKTEKLVKLDILLNGEALDALSVIVHRDRAYNRGRDLAAKLKEIIPRQMYEVAIQAAIGSKIIARETISAFRKDVTAKCYGGDISRKRKLLEKQKEGKKRMKQVGRIEVPQDAFLAVLRIDSNS